MNGPVPAPGQPPRALAGRLAMIFFFGVFLLAGLGATWFLTVPAYRDYFAARSWDRVDCRILSAEVTEHASDEGGATYSIAVRFAYERDGREHQSDRATFFEGSSSGRESKARHVEALKADPAPVCYVDPADPDRAVLDPSLSPMALLALMPLLFVAVGGGGLMFALRPARDAAAPLPIPTRPGDPGRAAAIRTARATRGADGFIELTAARSPLVAFCAVTLFDAVWNTVVGVMLWNAWNDGDIEWGLLLFGGLFACFGLILLGLNVHQFLALFNPRPRIAVSSDAVLPGDDLTVRWTIDRPERIARLTIALEGRESATYTRGTDTCTDTEPFVRMPILETSRAAEMRRGERRARIPADAVPTFLGRHNTLTWHLKVDGEIPKWPDIDLDFGIAVTAPKAGM